MRKSVCMSCRVSCHVMSCGRGRTPKTLSAKMGLLRLENAIDDLRTGVQPRSAKHSQGRQGSSLSHLIFPESFSEGFFGKKKKRQPTITTLQSPHSNHHTTITTLPSPHYNHHTPISTLPSPQYHHITSAIKFSLIS